MEAISGFKTSYSGCDKSLCSSCCGSPVRHTYKLAVVGGVHQLIDTGSYNQDEEIQSYADSCDMSVIMNKLMTGEISAELTPDMCADIYSLPKDNVERYMMIGEIRNEFSNLPLEIQAQFNNDPLTYLLSAWEDSLHPADDTLDVLSPEPEPKGDE